MKNNQLQSSQAYGSENDSEQRKIRLERMLNASKVQESISKNSEDDLSKNQNNLSNINKTNLDLK